MMKARHSLILTVIGLTLCGTAPGQNYDTNNVSVRTFAGSGFYGYYDGQGVLTMFNAPTAVAADPIGNLFVYDSNNGRIRKISPSGIVTTFAGGGNGSLPGFGTNVALPYGYGNSHMTIDHSNMLWLAIGSYLLRIGPDTYVAPQNTSLNYSTALCVDSTNNLYYTSDNRIIRYNPYTGQSEVFAGSGNPGSRDGNWIFSSFNAPTALAADAANSIYVWDSGSRLIRRINQNRDVETIAGTNNSQYCYNCEADGVGPQATFASVNDMCVDSDGNLLLACGTSIRKVSAATNVTTLAGSFSQIGYTNGPGSVARFVNAYGICAVQSSIFIADSGDHRIRKMTFDSLPQIVPETNLGLKMYPGLQIKGEVGRTYRIESSVNLTNWTQETIVLLTSTPYLWVDVTAQAQTKYYRTLLLP
jgi:hypothetical protein